MNAPVTLKRVACSIILDWNLFQEPVCVATYEAFEFEFIKNTVFDTIISSFASQTVKQFSQNEDDIVLNVKQVMEHTRFHFQACSLVSFATLETFPICPSSYLFTVLV